ncbi:Chromosome segregation protein BIR1 [Rasamsonia emersonii CBS 393.64]|uniref:Chromosome segregation protein BIR1 n=1 Tax=Rasamsonia emersonii (strain ATCC 16479 / CBS 393.64 / IMI 116815) TaxID=1408163 RepID=A0A0F4Z121_RASE3|nr:Chromosome segregation protein BIR1 [Rasamsonia emersonii CBS 393.64]KKA24189.1 Chromosome segregation protein BIR1 [Rasamsonia emersonii CBS 393.64]
MAHGMQTFAARLASFDLALWPAKHRASSAKGVKPITWPHKRPSPAELAHAGFYYKPYETNPDNTMCFLCERALDGWEEDDNPIAEHLKHSRDCGWAIMMNIQQHSSNPAEIEDPTSPAIVEARRATFGSSWPHDGKPGWLCQSDKMVAAGWYFCPTEESADLASCAYCKLSLDGWEPQDDPFDEHYRRSSDCSFFVFALPQGKNAKKSSRSKKPRTSKASRLSTQSTITVASEAPSVADDAMDQSILSQSTVKTTKSTKKATKSKTKRTKKDDPAEVGSQMDVDSIDEKQPEISKPKRATRGKKRASEEISQDLQNGEDEETFHAPEPPAKRRATQVRNSMSEQPTDGSTEQSVSEQNVAEEATSPVVPKKGRKNSKKSTSSRNRKTSAASTATKASLRSRVPDDSELEAAIEADFDRDVYDDKGDSAHLKDEPADQHTSKPARQSTAASVAPIRASQQVNEGAHLEQLDGHYGEEPGSDAVEVPATKAKTQKPGKRKTTTKKSKKEAISSQDIPEAPIPTSSDAVEEKPESFENFQPHDSLVSVEIQVRHPDAESDLGTENKPAPRKASKKPAKGKKTANTSKADMESMASENQEEPTAREETKSRTSVTKRESIEVDGHGDEVRSQNERDQQEARQSQVRRSSKVPPKTTERYSDIPQEQHRTQSLLGSLARQSDAQKKQAETATRASSGDKSQSGPVQESTPSPSPQSSDAENRPPSTRPSALRPPVLSPSKTQTIRVPIATSTPLSQSKRHANTGYLTSSYPWTPVDIEEIIFGATDDKENRDLLSIKETLTSPEKKMTVEEWILWNAKNGEEKLKRECERLVSLFEREGGER